MPNYRVSNAFYGYAQSEVTGYDSNVDSGVPVTDDIQKLLENNSSIKLNSNEPGFGVDTAPVLKNKINLTDPNTQVYKLIIQLQDQDGNTTDFYLIRGRGWAVKDSISTLKQSSKPDEILILSKTHSYRAASTADDAEEIAKAIVATFGGGVAAQTGAGKLARSGAEAVQKAGDVGQDIFGKVKGFAMDTINYDGGREYNPQHVAPLQRCLIRLDPSKGNLAMERANLQPTTNPPYTPIVGIKITGKKNYADDGRFGIRTLDAVRRLMDVINTKNQNDPNFQEIKITDPENVPVKVLYSTACKINTQIDILPDEQEKFDSAMAAAKTTKVSSGGVLKGKGPPLGKDYDASLVDQPEQQQESKVYKDYGFLSTKNNKLHSILMEQLKKDLKRG